MQIDPLHGVSPTTIIFNILLIIFPSSERVRSRARFTASLRNVIAFDYHW